ncbi:MAG: hypothetical protein ABSB79_02880 [Syntrophales bacterium]|jgi:hypothetical protein
MKKDEKEQKNKTTGDDKLKEFIDKIKGYFKLGSLKDKKKEEPGKTKDKSPKKAKSNKQQKSPPTKKGKNKKNKNR